jgi:precorrin-3B methylase
VFREVGCHGVAEAAALAAVGADSALVVAKRKRARVTCAVAEAREIIDPNAAGRARGRLAIVGVGPGDPAWLTPEARHLLATSDAAVGYSLYLDLVAGLIAGAERFDFTLGAEEERVRLALTLAGEGRSVALVSSGDPGVYALAALAFELLDRDEADGADPRLSEIGLESHVEEPLHLSSRMARSASPGPINTSGSGLVQQGGKPPPPSVYGSRSRPDGRTGMTLGEAGRDRAGGFLPRHENAAPSGEDQGTVAQLPDGARRAEIVVAPGISAMQAAAARAGAPLGHDFCAISLSDLLTPWPAIEARIRAAAEADFVIAFYNPASQRRRTQLARAKAILQEHRPPDTPVLLARNLGRDGESVVTVPLADLDPGAVDMLTLAIVGASTTRQVTAGGRIWTYTPRGYEKKRQPSPPCGDRVAGPQDRLGEGEPVAAHGGGAAPSPNPSPQGGRE